MKLWKGLQQGSDEISDALNKEIKENKRKYKGKIKEKKKKKKKERKEGKTSLAPPWKMELDAALVKIDKQVGRLFWYFKTEHRGR